MLGFKPFSQVIASIHGLTFSPQVNTSTAAYPNSGHVWIAKWDSEITTTPLTPGD